MAGVQEEFGNRLGEGYMANLGESSSIHSSTYSTRPPISHTTRCPHVPLILSTRASHSYLQTEQAQSTVSEYKSLRKKLESRRLALDAAISKLNNNKKGDPGMLEEDVELAKMRLYVDPGHPFSLPPYRLNLPQLKRVSY
jgi:hypothetical protein